MPDTRAALTMASDGGNTRFSISTDSMADVGALMVMVSWVQRKIGRYCRTRYLQATDAAYRQCRDAGTRLPQSDHARSLRPLTDDATLVSRHRSSVGLRWPSKRIAALHRLPIQLRMGCAMRLALRSGGCGQATTSDRRRGSSWIRLVCSSSCATGMSRSAASSSRRVGWAARPVPGLVVGA